MLAVTMTAGYLGLGSNLGDRLGHLRGAVARLDASGQLAVRRLSNVYETPPWGYDSPNKYYNMVLAVDWGGTPLQLQTLAHQVERDLWRMKKRGVPNKPYEDRTIDIDILWLEGVELDSPRLKLPHPLAHQRAFVLVPWNEIAPETMLGGRTISDWLKLLPPAELEAMKIVVQ